MRRCTQSACHSKWYVAQRRCSVRLTCWFHLRSFFSLLCFFFFLSSPRTCFHSPRFYFNTPLCILDSKIISPAQIFLPVDSPVPLTQVNLGTKWPTSSLLPSLTDPSVVLQPCIYGERIRHPSPVAGLGHENRFNLFSLRVPFSSMDSSSCDPSGSFAFIYCPHEPPAFFEPYAQCEVEGKELEKHILYT